MFLSPNCSKTISTGEVMKSHLLAMCIMVTMLSYSNLGWAENLEYQDVQFRLLIHGEYQFNDQFAIGAHIVPGGNLVTGLNPMLYLDFKYTPTKYLTIAPMIGVKVGPDDVILALHITPKIRKFWGWIDFEYLPVTESWYWFFQAQYQPLEWLAVGAEEESYGEFGNWDTSSHGGGPNVLFFFGKHIGVDLVLDFRQWTDVQSQKHVGVGVHLRLNLFFSNK